MHSSGILRAALLSSLVVACSSQRPAGTNGSAATVSVVSSGVPSTPEAPAASANVDAGAPPPVSDEAPLPDPTFDEIATVLFADRANLSAVTAACPPSTPPDARVRCLFDERYRGDAAAASLAHELYVKWRVVAGVEVAHTMNGGYRGMIRIEPALPIKAERKHIEWIVTAMRDFERFFAELDRHAPAEESVAAEAVSLQANHASLHAVGRGAHAERLRT